MFSLLNPTDDERSLIDVAAAHALALAQPGASDTLEPLPSVLLAVPQHRAYPPWLMLCRQVFVEGQHHARVGESPGPGLRGLRGPLHFDAEPVAPASASSHLHPQRVAQLAHEGQAESPAEVLLLRTLTQGHQPPPALSLHVALVGDSWGPQGRGIPAWLDLWVEPGLAPASLLLRAPGFMLAPADAEFETSLQRVQSLLRRALRPGAPSVAVGLRPRTMPGRDDGPPLFEVGGPSLGAALAVGALHLLLDHLQPGHEELCDQVQDLDPGRLWMSAALGELPPINGDGSRWPMVNPIGERGHKLATFRWLQQQGADDAAAWVDAIEGDEPRPLPAYIDDMARRAGSAMSPAARRLHHLLVRDDAEVVDRELIDAVHNEPAPATLKAWLVWRWAQRAGGRDAVFGPPLQLVRLYTRLVLARADERMRQPGVISDDAVTASQPQTYELDHLLDDPEFAHHPAWVLDAPPFAGKSTLLARREMDTARRALQALRGVPPRSVRDEAVDHIEISLYLPLRRLGTVGADAVEEALRRAAPALAAHVPMPARPGGPPRLPPLPPWLRHRIRVRLLLDGINEIAADTHAQRQATVHALCQWLAERQGLLLAPLFTVRERENSVHLGSPGHPAWAAASAQVLPWGADDCDDYIAQADLVESDAVRLRAAIHARADPGSLDDAFRSFCKTPGILAAQCALLRHHPGMTLPRQRGELFGALVWHALAGPQAPPMADAWLAPDLRGPGALKAAQAQGWRLPDPPGLLLQQLYATALAMVSPQGLPRYEVPVDLVAPGLHGDAGQRATWLALVQRLGLCTLQNGRFAFAHQQWQEFFLALARNSPQAPLPDVRPPPLDPPSGQPLLDHLQVEGTRLELPAVSPHQERLRFAAEASVDPAAWVRRLLPINLPLAARIAADHQPRLEPDGAYPGEGRRGPHPVLQLLRHALLLTCVDAGAEVRERVTISGMLGLIEEPIEGLPAGDSLAQWWRRRQAEAFRAEIDIRQRIEAGLLLGDLHDNLRYRLVTVTAPEGDLRTGLRLKDQLWATFGTPGRKTPYWVKTPYWAGNEEGDPEGNDDEKPRQVWLRAFAMARLPVTMGEWAWFEDAGFRDPEAPWWRGDLEQIWFTESHRREREAKRVKFRLANRVQPATCLNAWEARAYAEWARPLYARAGPQMSATGVTPINAWPLRLPHELMWEAAVRQLDGRPKWWQTRRRPTRGPLERASLLRPLSANTRETRLWATSPVAAFSRSLTAAGLADAIGNQWERCHEAHPAWKTLPAAALRGGSFFSTASQCSLACRDYSTLLSNYVGVRLVRVQPPHSASRTPGA